MTLVTPSIIFCTSCTSVKPMRCLFEMSHLPPTAALCSPADPRGWLPVALILFAIACIPAMPQRVFLPAAGLTFWLWHSLKKRQTAARAAAPAQPRASRQAAASKAEPPPLPFRVVGAELRAGQRSVSVAPTAGDLTPDQLQVLLPGDAVGPWRLQAIEGNAAVFQAGDQTRRVAIP